MPNVTNRVNQERIKWIQVYKPVNGFTEWTLMSREKVNAVKQLMTNGAGWIRPTIQTKTKMDESESSDSRKATELLRLFHVSSTCWRSDHHLLIGLWWTTCSSSCSTSCSSSSVITVSLGEVLLLRFSFSIKPSTKTVRKAKGRHLQLFCWSMPAVLRYLTQLVMNAL